MDYTKASNDQLLSYIRDFWELAKRMYANDFQRIKILDQTDRGELWKATGMVFPEYQLLPDTNHVTYVKSNLVASIYSVAKSATIIQTSEKDKEICQNLNVALDAVWDTRKVGFYQFQAGERAALCNLGITQIGWDENITEGSGEQIRKGNIRLKNIDPLKFMRDPYATDVYEGNFCVTFDDFHKSVFLTNPAYREAFKEYQQQASGGMTETHPVATGPDGISKSGAKDYYTLFKWWVKNDNGSISEIHEVNHAKILTIKHNIKPNMYPFAFLHCNLPAGALIGTSEPAKIFANSVLFNMLDSIICTAEYKNQHPPRFISDQSKLNPQVFAKYGNDADKTFVVAGDASKSVHYLQYPQVSQAAALTKQSLGYGIQDISGVDGRYTGRDTGSIITTGGTEEMLNRVTLIDTPKITMYEDYCKTLSKLIILNMLEHCPTRSFYRQDPRTREWKTTEVDFPKLDVNTMLDYRISISSELPKNKQRIAAAATELLKAQAQYRQEGSNVNWITEEEWLMCQDIPFKEMMLERMGIQRFEDSLQDVAQVLYQFSDLVQNGATPDQAMQATAETLRQTRQGITPQLAAGTNPDLQQMAMQPQTQMPMK